MLVKTFGSTVYGVEATAITIVVSVNNHGKHFTGNFRIPDNDSCKQVDNDHIYN